MYRDAKQRSQYAGLEQVFSTLAWHRVCDPGNSSLSDEAMGSMRQLSKGTSQLLVPFITRLHLVIDLDFGAKLQAWVNLALQLHAGWHLTIQLTHAMFSYQQARHATDAMIQVFGQHPVLTPSTITLIMSTAHTVTLNSDGSMVLPDSGPCPGTYLSYQLMRVFLTSCSFPKLTCINVHEGAEPAGDTEITSTHTIATMLQDVFSSFEESRQVTTLKYSMPRAGTATAHALAGMHSLTAVEGIRLDDEEMVTPLPGVTRVKVIGSTSLASLHHAYPGARVVTAKIRVSMSELDQAACQYINSIAASEHSNVTLTIIDDAVDAPAWLLAGSLSNVTSCKVICSCMGCGILPQVLVAANSLTQLMIVTESASVADVVDELREMRFLAMLPISMRSVRITMDVETICTQQQLLQAVHEWFGSDCGVASMTNVCKNRAVKLSFVVNEIEYTH